MRYGCIKKGPRKHIWNLIGVDIETIGDTWQRTKKSLTLHTRATNVKNQVSWDKSWKEISENHFQFAINIGKNKSYQISNQNLQCKPHTSIQSILLIEKVDGFNFTSIFVIIRWIWTLHWEKLYANIFGDILIDLWIGRRRLSHRVMRTFVEEMSAICERWLISKYKDKSFQILFLDRLIYSHHHSSFPEMIMIINSRSPYNSFPLKGGGSMTTSKRVGGREDKSMFSSPYPFYSQAFHHGYDNFDSFNDHLEDKNWIFHGRLSDEKRELEKYIQISRSHMRQIF